MIELRDVLTKTIIPIGLLLLWSEMSKTILAVSGNANDVVLFLFLIGLPFGIGRACIFFIPRGYDLGGTLGMLMFGIVISSFMGIFVAVWYIIRAVYISVKYILETPVRCMCR